MKGLDQIAAALLACCGPASAAVGFVRMQTPPPVMKDIAAMPVIADPTDEAQRRINTAVKRLDEPVRKAAAECKTDGGKDSDWSRNVDVTMHGPRFLSYTITDNAFCGGAYPNVSTAAIVYDLQTGRPVDWTKLLPTSLTGKVALNEDMDGTKMVTLSSQKLHALYLKNYRPRSGDAKRDADDEDCRTAVASTENGPPAMMAWLDAKAGGLAVEFDLPHVIQACADTVVIPVDALRVAGAQPALVDAIAAAHAQAKGP